MEKFEKVWKSLKSVEKWKRQGQGQGQGGQILTYQIIYFVKAHDTHHHLSNRQGGLG